MTMLENALKKVKDVIEDPSNPWGGPGQTSQMTQRDFEFQIVAQLESFRQGGNFKLAMLNIAAAATAAVQISCKKHKKRLRRKANKK
jgi:hypothetical protein